MKLLGTQLHGYTAAQSSTIGWKENCCGKTVNTSNNTTGMLRLTVANGNPEFFFSTLQEEVVTNNNGYDIKHISWAMGWRVNTSGGIDNPNGNGAANFIPFQLDWLSGNINWAYWTVGTRTITWNTTSSSSSSTTTIHRVMVYSERIDLITLSCI